MFNILNLKNNKKGTSLFEMIVSVALFAIIMVMATGIFKMVIEGQRNAIASQNTQESIRYAFEMMSKEMRMAQKDDGTCDSSDVYSVNGNSDILYFKNYYGECVTYQLDGDRLKIIRGYNEGYITSSKVEVSDLKFFIQGDPSVSQPTVTMKIKVRAIGKEMHGQEIIMQTTISSRHYE